MPYRSSGVDARLIDILETARATYPLRVEFISGMRDSRASSQHDHGRAIDVQIYDGDGNPIPNYQNGTSFRAYERFAQYVRAVQQEKYPELKDGLRWGGYFSGDRGKYGAADLMHFDLGGTVGMKMAGGSWEDGLTNQQRRYFPSAVSLGLGRVDPVVARLFGPTGPKPPADIPPPKPKSRPTEIAYAQPERIEPRLVNAVVGESRRFANGSEGPQVQELQHFLNAHGVKDAEGKPLAEDGIFGARTEAAVRAYQRASGLVADGVVGRKTAVTMLRDDQVPLPRPRPGRAVQPTEDGVAAPIPRPRPAFAAGEELGRSVAAQPVVIDGRAPVTPVTRASLPAIEPDPVAERGTRELPSGLIGDAVQQDMSSETTDAQPDPPGPNFDAATDPVSPDYDLRDPLQERAADRSIENPNPGGLLGWFWNTQTNLGTANSPLASGVDEYMPQAQPQPGASTVKLFQDGNTVADMMAGFNASQMAGRFSDAFAPSDMAGRFDDAFKPPKVAHEAMLWALFP